VLERLVTVGIILGALVIIGAFTVCLAYFINVGEYLPQKLYWAMKRKLRGMKSWERVLSCWKNECGRTGLTIHALAHITQQEPSAILKSLKEQPHIYGQYCSVVRAPIFSWGGSVDYPLETREPWIIMSKWALEHIPYPENISIQGMKGKDTLVGVNQSDLARLKKAAKAT
jgi:hypothetical protein